MQVASECCMKNLCRQPLWNISIDMFIALMLHALGNVSRSMLKNNLICSNAVLKGLIYPNLNRHYAAIKTDGCQGTGKKAETCRGEAWPAVTSAQTL